jgi:hypothetical protein
MVNRVMVTRGDVEAIRADLKELENRYQRRHALAQGIADRKSAIVMERRRQLLCELREWLDSREDLIELQARHGAIDHLFGGGAA